MYRNWHKFYLHVLSVQEVINLLKSQKANQIYINFPRILNVKLTQLVRYPNIFPIFEFQ